MKREEAIKDYIMPALKRTWHDDRCIEIISAIEQDPCEVVLNKIRAEIKVLPRELPTDARNMVRKTRVLDIIDKYTEGVRDKE